MDSFRITELGRRFGLSRSTLLYYDRIGLLCPSGRSEADYRLYSQADCDRLARICAFREAGISLEEIARLLDADTPHGPILERRLHELGQAGHAGTEGAAAPDRRHATNVCFRAGSDRAGPRTVAGFATRLRP
ncbi:MerR family transcriptional regulator [Accumulibacter sp.]|uniref:MerR family transcriptional regulator n=1 Tax=Accumulibacter sp. TaxID=2053492 RepID=UPI0025B8BAAE|nr:MerR family transcriptional regulator [Accumulibacter sp.]